MIAKSDYLTSERIAMQDDMNVRKFYRRKYRNERIMKLVFWVLLVFAVGATFACVFDLWKFFRG